MRRNWLERIIFGEGTRTAEILNVMVLSFIMMLITVASTLPIFLLGFEPEYHTGASAFISGSGFLLMSSLNVFCTWEMLTYEPPKIVARKNPRRYYY